MIYGSNIMNLTSHQILSYSKPLHQVQKIYHQKQKAKGRPKKDPQPETEPKPKAKPKGRPKKPKADLKKEFLK